MTHVIFALLCTVQQRLHGVLANVTIYSLRKDTLTRVQSGPVSGIATQHGGDLTNQNTKLVLRKKWKENSEDNFVWPAE